MMSELAAREKLRIVERKAGEYFYTYNIHKTRGHIYLGVYSLVSLYIHSLLVVRGGRAAASPLQIRRSSKLCCRDTAGAVMSLYYAKCTKHRTALNKAASKHK